MHQAEFNGRDCLFLSRVPGQTLSEAWPTLDEKWERDYVNAIVNACEAFASWEYDKLGRIDGKNVPEFYLTSHEDFIKNPPNGDCDSGKFHQVSCPEGWHCWDHRLGGISPRMDSNQIPRQRRIESSGFSGRPF